MKYYHAIVHKDPDSAFGVSFPDLPGCFSAADRMEDVIPNAVEAIELWFEDSAMVDPRPLEDVREEARDDLAAGAFLVAVPYIRADERTTKVTLSMNRGVLDAIDAAAAARRLTRSAFVAQAARNEIEGRH